MKFLKTFAQVLTFLVLLTTVFAIKNSANAQVPIPSATCTINNQIVNTVQIPFDNMIGVPANFAFSFNLTCSPGGQYTVSLVQLTGTPPTPVGSTYFGNGSGQYGPWGPFPVSITPYKLIVDAVISGQPANMTCTNCTFRSANGITVPSPPPPPTPTPVLGGSPCPPTSGAISSGSGWQYSPNPPQLNQAFQLQLNVPTNGSTVGQLILHLTDDTTNTTTDIGIVDAARTFGIWFAPIPAQTHEVSWHLIGTPTGASTTIECATSSIFNGVGMKAGAQPGENPCQDGVCKTAFGNISTSTDQFATTILTIGASIGGGLALILMVFGAITILTSQGDPKNVAAGRERMIAAVAGLVFIILAAVILRFIGFSIFAGVPGL